MKDDYTIIIVLLTIVGTVTVIILFYFLLMCLSAIRTPFINPSASRSTRSRSIVSASNAQSRPSVRRAAQNVYMSHPNAPGDEDPDPMTTRDIASRTGHATITIPSSLFLNSRGMPLPSGSLRSDGGGHSQELEVLRFYTAEELANFPFDEHVHRVTGSRSDTYEPVQLLSRESDEASTEAPPTLRNNPMRFTSSHHQHHPHQSVFIRNPQELFMGSGGSQLLNARMNRRLCYSIPSNYIGRPPAYLPAEDQPPSYDDALRVVQALEEQEKSEGPSSSSSG